MWGGYAWAAAPVASVWEAISSPVWTGGVGGGLDAWDRRFSRELEKIWARPKRKHVVIEEDEEAAAVLRMLGFLP